MEASQQHAGTQIVQVLQRHGVRFLYTLCGGHISPILTAAEQLGVRVVDVRHEATAVFAADATARLTGIPGVAAVTAGPGVTNTLTALKNAQMAQSPVVLLGGGVLVHAQVVAVQAEVGVRDEGGRDRACPRAGLRHRALGHARPGVPGAPGGFALSRVSGAAVVRPQAAE